MMISSYALTVGRAVTALATLVPKSVERPPIENTQP